MLRIPGAWPPGRPSRHCCNGTIPTGSPWFVASAARLPKALGKGSANIRRSHSGLTQKKRRGLDNQLHRPTEPRLVQSPAPVAAVNSSATHPAQRTGNPGSDGYQVENKSVPIHRRLHHFPVRSLGTYRFLSHDAPSSTHPSKGQSTLRSNFVPFPNFTKSAEEPNDRVHLT